MKITAALFCLFVSLSPAATRKEIDELVDRARAAPAEFAADALIRLAASDAAASPERKRELLEEAFRRAAGAQQPLRKRAVAPASVGPAGFLDRAFAQGLDANSLQCRAVRALLPVDRRKARELFREIPEPAVKRYACEDSLVADVTAYYETLGEVLKSFTPAEAAEDEPFKLLQEHFHGLQSPLQVGPVAQLLAAAPLKEQQFAGLLMSFAGALKDLAGDDRSFAFAASPKGRVGQHMAALVAAAGKQGASTTPLLEAYRAFLVRHLSGERCADSFSGPGLGLGLQTPGTADYREALMDPAQFFNDKLRVDPLKPIGGDETSPSKMEGAAGGLRACESPECKDIAGGYRGLIFGSNGMPIGNGQKTTAEWQGKLKEYLAALARWKEDSVSTAGEQFQQKCLFYSDLFNIVPNGPDRVQVLRAFLDFVKQNAYQRESRLEWFLPVNSLIARVSLDPAGLAEILNDMRNSQDPVIALYTAIEQATPRSPAERLSVL